MSTFFASKFGQGAIINISNGQPGSFSGSDFPAQQVIFIGEALNHETNTQFMPTFSGRIFIQGFGDKIGVKEVQGIVPLYTCNSPSLGIKDILSYYKNKRFTGDLRVSNINIRVPGYTEPGGYLVGFNASLVARETIFYSFTLRYAVVP